MELPQFNPDGTGPQGTAGIPPDEIRQALREVAGNPNAGTELITGSMKPEDTAGAQAILAAETSRILGDLGVTQEQATPQQTPATQPDTSQQQPPAVQQQAPSSEPAAAVPAGSDLESRISAVREKYKGNVDEIAKAYIHTDAARTRAQQNLSTVESQVLRELGEVKAQLASFAPKPTPEPPLFQTFPKDTSPTPQATPQPQPQPGDEDFYSQMRKMMREEIQTNLIALKQAEIRQRRDEEFQKQVKATEGEVQRLRPIIVSLYNEDRELYDSLPPEAQHRLLLKNAKDREMALAGYEIYNEVMGNPPGNGQVRQAPGPGASLPSQGATTRSIATPTPANGDYSRTQNMKQLWRSTDGSVDEERVMMNVFKERGVGEDIR